MELEAWLAALPKVELHLHLEGAIPHDALWTLIEKYGGDPSVPTRVDLATKFRYRDFPHFIETWVWKNQFLREYDDFTLIAAAMAADLKAQNVRYAESFFSPSRFAPHGLEPQALASAIRRGLDSVDGIEVALIADLVRDHGPDSAARTLDAVSEARDQGIVGIGIGGSEHAHPPAPFAPVYAEARRRGFRTTAHAGEAAGADSVRGAVEVLQVDRVGHGVRAIEDDALVDLLVERQIPLEICPLSNIATGTYTDIRDHPVARFWRRGAMVTISTDDPHMFMNTLVEEYRTLVDVFGFTAADIRRVILNGIDAAWLPDDKIEALRKAVCADPVWDAV